jgi:hypothetical protein
MLPHAAPMPGLPSTFPHSGAVQPPPPPHPGTPQVHWVYCLSNLQVGAVIGKGGSHISKVRQLSGAKVQLATVSRG